MAAAALAAACGEGPPGGAPGGTPAAEVEVVVSAAASLTDAFAEIETAFEEAHPGVDVLVNAAGSSTLRIQILEGAPVDVFAPAGVSDMDPVVAAGEVVGEPRIFARNRLQIAVPVGNPAGIVSLEDFADPDRLLGLCAEEVPCGEYARRALRGAGIQPAIDTNEPDVRALLTKVEVGELDGGITYVTDVASAAGRVEGIDIPEDVNVAVGYPIAVLARSSHPEEARAFVSFVLSQAGQTILARYGFLSP